MQVRKMKTAHWKLCIFTTVSDQQQCIFCNPYTTSKVTSVSTPFLVMRKRPIRKTFRSFRHSRATPGGSLLRMNTARLHSMTQGHSAVLPFLKLWKKTFSPLPSSHFERMQRNNINCKMFFLTLSFATDKSNR